MGRSEGGSTRESQAVAALQAGVMEKLQRNFQTRLYRFDSTLSRISHPGQLGAPAAPATHIGASLEQLLTQSEGLPLGAVVLLSDGGDNSGGVDRNVIEALRNHRIPVYTVGFGDERVSRRVPVRSECRCRGASGQPGAGDIHRVRPIRGACALDFSARAVACIADFTGVDDHALPQGVSR